MGVFKRWGKKVAKGVKRAVKRRYVGKQGQFKAGRLVRDVAYLKSVLNPEKKRIQLANGVSGAGTTVGQVNGNGAGHLAVDITPNPAEGIQYNTRNGASIKLHSSNFNFQFSDQSAQVSKMRFIIDIWRIKGVGLSALGYSINNIVNNVYQSNVFITGGTGVTMVDYFSPRNPDFMKSAELIRSVKTTVQADQTPSSTNLTSFRFGIKYNRGKGTHVRFDKDTQGIAEGQLIMVIRADRGNQSDTTASTCTGISDIAVNTGAKVRYSIQHYYYDN